MLLIDFGTQLMHVNTCVLLFYARIFTKWNCDMFWQLRLNITDFRLAIGQPNTWTFRRDAGVWADGNELRADSLTIPLSGGCLQLLRDFPESQCVGVRNITR